MGGNEVVGTVKGGANILLDGHVAYVNAVCTTHTPRGGVMNLAQ
jgi:hypothetical protein